MFALKLQRMIADYQSCLETLFSFIKVLDKLKTEACLQLGILQICTFTLYFILMYFYSTYTVRVLYNKILFFN